MYGTFFLMQVKPGHKEHLIEALKKHGKEAMASEPGIRRLEFYQDGENENHVWFYEAYLDEEAFRTHLQGKSHIEH